LATRLTWENYATICGWLTARDIGPTFWNSIWCILVASTFATALTAYFGYRSTHYFPYQQWLLPALILALYSVPPITLVFPFGLLGRNTGFGGISLVTLATGAFVLPFCLRMGADYFEAIPVHAHRAAAVDGLQPFQALFAVFVPSMLPQLGIIVAFGAIVAGNDILFSRYLGGTTQGRTFVDVIQERITNAPDLTDYGAIAAFGTVAALLIVACFAYLQLAVFRTATDQT